MGLDFGLDFLLGKGRIGLKLVENQDTARVKVIIDALIGQLDNLVQPGFYFHMQVVSQA